MKWEHLFQSHILDRGYDYYQEGRVGNFDFTDKSIQADVYGNEIYEVAILLSHGKISDMDCDCPYSADGKKCKHMAATLYEWETHKELEKTTPADSTEVMSLVQSIDESILRKFLFEVLNEDKKLLERLKLQIHSGNFESPKPNKANYLDMIDDIFDTYVDDYDFIDYYQASEFSDDLLDFLDNEVKGLIDTNHLLAFELTCYLVEKIGDQEMDDSDGGMTFIMDQCFEIWLELLTDPLIEFKKAMFQWFIQALDGNIADFLENYVEEILFENFNEAHFLDAKWQLVDRKLADTNNKFSDYSEYTYEKWLLRKWMLLEQKAEKPQVIEAFIQANLTYPKIRENYVETLIEQEQYTKAIEVLNEGKQAHSDRKGLLGDYSERLKELYKVIGDTDSYLEELWLLVLEHEHGELEFYRELKSMYRNDEWLIEREKIFSKRKNDIEKLYQEEKLYDRLLECVIESDDLNMLNQYEKTLKEHYPKELLNQYAVIVKKHARTAGKRSHYQELVSVLRKMKTYPTGFLLVDEIVEDWKVQYKNRRAMMDELRKL